MWGEVGFFWFVGNKDNSAMTEPYNRTGKIVNDVWDDLDAMPQLVQFIRDGLRQVLHNDTVREQGLFGYLTRFVDQRSTTC